MLFCPYCGTLLLLQHEPNLGSAYFCQTCRFAHPVREVTITTTDLRHLNKAGLDGATEVEVNAAWDGKPKTTVPRCKNESCDSKQAYFEQTQIRSADEPPTTFYKCCSCGVVWRLD